MKIQAFVNIYPLIDNVPGSVSPIGELSADSRTFSKEHGVYKNITYPNVGLVTFQSENDDIDVNVPINLRDALLSISEWVYQTSRTNSYSDDSTAFRQIFTVQYTGYTVIDVGPMELCNGNWYPSYIIFSDNSNDYSLWFSDSEFSKEYSEYELYPILPFTEMDVLHLTRAEVIDKIENINNTDVFSKIDVVRGEYPFTHQFPLQVNWTDKNDPNIKRPLLFVVLIYGNEGKNLDLIKAKLVNAILSQSNYSREEWEKVLPELFLPNEFYITPMWFDVAQEGAISKKGVYSSSSNARQMLSYGLSTFIGMDKKYILENAEHIVTTYNSISAVVVGDKKNQTGIYKFEEMFPRFATLSTMDGSFNLLDSRTRKFITKLTEVLSYAERYDGERYVNLPNDLTLIKRQDKVYITFTYEKVNYLVSAYMNEIVEWTEEFFTGDSTSPGEPPIQSMASPHVIMGTNNSGAKSVVVRMMYYDPADDSFKPTPSSEGIKWDAFWVVNGEVVEQVQDLLSINNPGGEAELFVDTDDVWNNRQGTIFISARYSINPDFAPGVSSIYEVGSGGLS